MQGVARYDTALADRFAAAAVHHARRSAFFAPLVFRHIGWITGVGCKDIAATQGFTHRQLAADGHSADTWRCCFIHDGAAVATAFGIITAITRNSSDGQCIP